MPTFYKIIWCCPCLLDTADTLSHLHASHKSSHQSSGKPTFSELSLLFSISLPVYKPGKGGQRRSRGCTRRGMSTKLQLPTITAVNHRVIAGEKWQELGQWLEVLVQLERLLHRHAVKLFSKHITCFILSIWCSSLLRVTYNECRDFNCCVTGMPESRKGRYGSNLETSKG